jgi:hypothetical protein
LVIATPGQNSHAALSQPDPPPREICGRGSLNPRMPRGDRQRQRHSRTPAYASGPVASRRRKTKDRVAAAFWNFGL